MPFEKFSDFASGGPIVGTEQVVGIDGGINKRWMILQIAAYVMSEIIDSAPTTLDTLNELAAALGDDPNFATTVTNALAGKLSLSGGTMTGDIALGGTRRIIDSASPTDPGHLTTKNYVDTLFLPLTGGTMTGDIYLGGTRRVVGSASPIDTGDLTTKFYVDTNFQPLAATLTAIAPLATTSHGRSLLTGADAAATRTTLGLGTAATLNTGTSGATVPLLNMPNSWGASNTFAAANVTSGSGTAAFYIGTIAGQTALVSFRTGTAERWRFQKNNTAEAGANAGSDFALLRYADDGTTVLGTAIFITRSNGDVFFNGATRPGTDNAHSLGGVSNRWTGVYTVRVFWSATVFDAFGTGSPEGVVTAAVGSTYRRTDGGAATTFYVKESGTGNTGWVAK